MGGRCDENESDNSDSEQAVNFVHEGRKLEKNKGR
jgi:hypothetical protein